MHFLFLVVLPKVIVCCVGLLFFRKLSMPYKVLLGANLLALCVEYAGYFIGHTMKQPNLWLFNFYMPVDVALDMWLASFFLRPRIKKWLPVVLWGYICYWGVLVNENTIYNFAFAGLVADAFLQTTLFMFILVDNTMNSASNISKNPLFWLCMSLILYYAGNIPFISTLTIKANDLILPKKTYVTINDVLGVVCALFTLTSFILCGKTSQLKHSYVRSK